MWTLEKFSFVHQAKSAIAMVAVVMACERIAIIAIVMVAIVMAIMAMVMVMQGGAEHLKLQTLASV